MVDVHTPEQRSRNMSAIRGRDTRPEIVVRSLVHGMGYRYRLHRRDLPGKPDLVFPRLRKVIFVHGCFWHVHDCPYGRVQPATNAAFWSEKRGGNADRDRRHAAELRRAGWRSLVIWECEIRDSERLARRVKAFLER